MSISSFSKNDDYDFEIRVTLGHVQAGGADVGEVLAAVGSIKAKDHEGWFNAWDSLAARTAGAAGEATSAGNSATAAGAYLRAANYYAVAVNAVASLEDADDLLPIFRKHRAAWDGFVDNCPVPAERVSIPYEDSELPGLLLRPQGAEGRLPVVIMNNGSDGAISAMWSQGGAAALARGYVVLIFDGPGQQSMLFERNVPFRHDWEAVITPVVDFLTARDDVDADRLALFGVSQAGYWVPRALAFEQRIAAAIIDPGVVDVFASWAANLPKSLLKLVDQGKEKKFDKDMRLGFKLQPALERTWSFRARPYGAKSYYETVVEVQKYVLDEQLAANIRTPLLITDPEGEQFWPGQSERLAKMTESVSTLIKFTAAEGADFHCQPLARSLTHERAYDWLDGVFKANS